MKIIKWIPEKEYKKIFNLVPRVTVDLVIFNRRKEVLLSKRDIPPRKGYWHLPGGRVRKGERISQAAKRIAKDETGLEVKLGDIRGLFDSPKRVPGMHDITLVITTKSVSGKLRGSWQARELRFFKNPPKMFFEHNKEVQIAKKGAGFYWKEG